MRHKQVGRWGVRVSCIGLGSWYTLGSTVENDRSVRIIKRAYDLGITLFDTANVYSKEYKSGGGEAEVLMGLALREYDRSSFVLTTKVGGRMGKRPNDRGLSAKHIREQCEASLRRLQTDYIDIYMCHAIDELTPMDETVRAMEDLARQGKIIYWGAEWTPADLVRAKYVARELGTRPPAAIMNRYNLMFRFPEADLFPVLRRDGMGCFAFSPLAQGILTGKYKPGTPPPEGTRAADSEHGKYLRKLYWSDDNLARTQELAAIAAGLGISAGQLALAWVIGRPEIASAIVGATRPEQLDENVRAATVELSDEVIARIEKLFPPSSGVVAGNTGVPILVGNSDQ